MNFDGTKLKERRIELRRSLIDAGTACSVSVEFLKALEDGDLDPLPPRIFSLGIVRSYCNYLDLPADGYLGQLEEALGTARSRPDSTQTPTERGNSQSRTRLLTFTLSTELTTWIAVCALLFLGWFSYSTLLRSESENAQTQVQAASVESPRHPDRSESE